jgi:hypothetical protein
MHRSRIVTLLALLLAFGAAVAGELTIRQFALPGLGTLTMPVPDAWNSQIRPSIDGLPPTLALTAKSGPAFELLITASAEADAAALRRQVKRMARAAKALASEHALSIMPLKGATGVGYYFTATDRRPAAGGYKFLTQGVMPVGGKAIVFTMRSSDGADATVSAALLLLQDLSVTTPAR